VAQQLISPRTKKIISLEGTLKGAKSSERQDLENSLRNRKFFPSSKKQGRQQ